MSGGRNPAIVRFVETSRGRVPYIIFEFINEIKARPAIWQKSHIDNRNAEVIEENFREICRIIVPYYDELDEGEQEMIVKPLYLTWKRIKDNLQRNIKTRMLSQDYLRPNPYILHMGFYLKMKRIKIDTLFDKDALKIVDEAEKEQAIANYIIKDSNGRYKFKISNNESLQQTEQRPRMHLDDEDSASSGKLCEDGIVYDYRQQQQYIANTPSPLKRNPDQAFFDSMKPILDKMDDGKKMDFKIEILEALQRYSNNC